MESNTPVTASGPLGQISADQMQITADTVTPGAYVLVFKNRVKLLYDPKSR